MAPRAHGADRFLHYKRRAKSMARKYRCEINDKADGADSAGIGGRRFWSHTLRIYCAVRKNRQSADSSGESAAGRSAKNPSRASPAPVP
jgi:hypothetical protein